MQANAAGRCLFSEMPTALVLPVPLQGQESSEGSSITVVPQRGDQVRGLSCSLLPWCHPEQLYSFSPSEQGLSHLWLRAPEDQSVLQFWVSRRQHILCPCPQARWWAFALGTAVHLCSYCWSSLPVERCLTCGCHGS